MVYAVLMAICGHSVRLIMRDLITIQWRRACWQCYLPYSAQRCRSQPKRASFVLWELESSLRLHW